MKEMQKTLATLERKTNIGPSHERCAHLTHHGGNHFKWDVVLKEHLKDNVWTIRHKQGWHPMAPCLRVFIAADRGAALRCGSPNVKKHLLRVLSYLLCGWAWITVPFSTFEVIRVQSLKLGPLGHTSWVN